MPWRSSPWRRNGPIPFTVRLNGCCVCTCLFWGLCAHCELRYIAIALCCHCTTNAARLCSQFLLRIRAVFNPVEVAGQICSAAVCMYVSCLEEEMGSAQGGTLGLTGVWGQTTNVLRRACAFQSFSRVCDSRMRMEGKFSSLASLWLGPIS